MYFICETCHELRLRFVKLVMNYVFDLMKLYHALCLFCCCCDLICLEVMKKKNRANSALLCTLPPDHMAVGNETLPPEDMAVGWRNVL